MLCRCKRIKKEVFYYVITTVLYSAVMQIQANACVEDRNRNANVNKCKGSFCFDYLAAVNQKCYTYCLSQMSSGFIVTYLDATSAIFVAHFKITSQKKVV